MHKSSAAIENESEHGEPWLPFLFPQQLPCTQRYETNSSQLLNWDMLF